MSDKKATKKPKESEEPKEIIYSQVNVGFPRFIQVDCISVQRLLSERALCKLAKNYERADAIARSLQGMNVSYWRV